MVVGSNTGKVHTERQGTGLATVLNGDKAVDAYGRYVMYDAAKRQKADQDAQAKKAAALAKLTSFAPEYFYKHKETIQPQLQSHIEKGADFLSRNVDPFTSGDSSAIEWQKEHQRLQAIADMSKQVQDEYKAFRQDIDGKDPNDYTADSLQANLDFFETPIEEILSSGKKRPPLAKKTEWQDAFSFVGKSMQDWTKSKAAPTPDEVEGFVTSLMSDPANQKYMQSYAIKLGQLPEEEQMKIKQAAKAAGISDVQQMAIDDANRWMKGKEPLDLMKVMSAAATYAESGVDYSDYQSSGVRSKQPKKGSVDQAAKNAASDLFNTHPDFMTIFDRSGDLPRANEESDASYAARVKAYLTKGIKERMKIDTLYAKDDKRSGDDKLIETRNQFVKDMRSGDPALITSAMQLMTGTPLLSNSDLKIDNFYVFDHESGGWAVRIEFNGKGSSKEISNAFGAPESQVSQSGDTRFLTIPLSDQSVSNQLLSRLYDNYVKQTGSYYDTKLSERSVMTADGAKNIVPMVDRVQQGAAKGGVIQTKPGAAPLNSFFK